MSKAQALVGAEFDGFRIIGLLGQGGMGAVYEARDIGLNRRVAIKVLAQDINRDPDAVKRFQRESRAVASVSHPNIAQVYRVGMYGDLHYYAMEYVDGTSLEGILTKGGHISGKRAFDIMIQAVGALKAALEHGIIHRDIKPANLMLTNDGAVKIVDFGIAKIMNDSDTFRTATGTIMGTPAYMSPEQCKGRELDFRADMYSLGCTFFHMLTGRPPFDGETLFQVMAKQISTPIPAIPTVTSNVPDRLCNIIYTMVEKDPDNRYQSYEHLLTVLEAAREGRAAGLTAEVLHETPVAPGWDWSKPELRRYLYLIVGFVVIILLLFISHMNRKEPVQPPAAGIVEGEDVPTGGLKGVAEGLRELHKVDKEVRDDRRKVTEE